MRQKIILPRDLKGPRSYFTDLDPIDPHYDITNAKYKLKMQLLLKDKITIAASSLFTRIGYELFMHETGLSKALYAGIIVPAIRNVYSNTEEYFEGRKTDCPESGIIYFKEHVTHILPWDLKDNSIWFMKTFFSHIVDSNSILRKRILIDDIEALNIKARLECEVANREGGFLTREDVENAFLTYRQSVREYVQNYVNLLYRIFGSKAVFCESHFPQSNLTSIGITENDSKISDERIFWDIYVEAIVSFFNSALTLTPERLDKLNFEDILRIRKAIFDTDFRSEYDNLVKKAKDYTEIEDTEKMFLKEEEITNASHELRRQFSERVSWEIHDIEFKEREKVLWTLANVLASFSTSGLASIISVLSNCLAIPEITSFMSPALGRVIKGRLDSVRSFLNSKFEWSKNKRQVLLKRYKEFLLYGLPG